eukprot:10507798-Heterocapsa_arctica.AAC.1
MAPGHSGNRGEDNRQYDPVGRRLHRGRGAARSQQNRISNTKHNKHKQSTNKQTNTSSNTQQYQCVPTGGYHAMAQQMALNLHNAFKRADVSGRGVTSRA